MLDVNCPSCFKTIPASQSYEGVYICSCGHKVRAKTGSQNGAGASAWIVIFSLLALGAFIHTANWDTYSVRIVPLKAKQILGLASLSEYHEIAEICEVRKKSFCQETALQQAAQIDVDNKDLLMKIAELQIGRESYEAAVQTLSAYFRKGGKDRLARYNLAVSLSKVGQTSEAKRHLHYLVFSKGQLDPVAARSYVTLLMAEGDYQTAQKVIRHCRGLGNNTAMFLEKEWKEIQKKLKVASQSRNA